MHVRSLWAVSAVLVHAGYLSPAVADWRFEERAGSGGDKIYAASADGDMGLECGRGGASLWVRVQVLGWKEIKSTEATLGFQIKKKGSFGIFGSTRSVLAFGRYDPPNSLVVTARVEGNQAIDLARKLADADEAVVTVEPKSASLMPTRGEARVSLAGAADAIGRLVERCRVGG